MEFAPFYKARLIKAWFSVKANKESSRTEKKTCFREG